MRYSQIYHFHKDSQHLLPACRWAQRHFELFLIKNIQEKNPLHLKIELILYRATPHKIYLLLNI